MKRLLFFILIAACIGIILPSKAQAFDLTVGATTWYAVWDLKADGESVNGSQDVKKGKASFLYGPVLSSKINDDFSISFVYLYGKFDMKLDNTAIGVNNEKVKYKRNDGDLAFNYRLNNYFEIFAGMKYVELEVPFIALSTGSSHPIKHYGYGPGLGISFTCPISYNLFLLANISGLYLWGKEKLELEAPEIGYNEKLNEYGVNSSLSIAYYIAPASIVISLGGRYQYVKTVYEGTEFVDFTYGVLSTNKKLSNVKNHMYGITLTATYTFSF